MKDIEDIADIRLFVDEFYTKVRCDELIGPVFAKVISDNWELHLNKMYMFWNAALFGVAGFKGNPFAKHAPLGLSPIHFDQWLRLFSATIDDYFVGPMAEDTKRRAEMMAVMFISKLERMNGDAWKVVV